MADPTATISRNYQIDRDRQVIPIKNAEALKIGGVAALNRSLGKIEFADDAADLIPVGIVIGEKNGQNDSLTGDSGGTVEGVTKGGIILEKVPVTGAAAITDRGKLVYMTDGQTFDLTRPATRAVPYGFVLKWHSGTSCDVYVFDEVEGLMVTQLMQPHKGVKYLGTILSNGLQDTSARTLWTEVSEEHYTIDSLHAQTTSYDTGIIAGAQTLNMDIAGTNTTGGVLTLGFADMDAAADLGAIVNATAITAANEVHVGDTVKLELAAGTGFTAAKLGAVLIYMKITRLAGA